MDNVFIERLLRSVKYEHVYLYSYDSIAELRKGLSFPLGPKQSAELGPITIRGKDRWLLGLETKVKETDDYIDPHDGPSPTPRLGFFSDVLDYDRAKLGSLLANRYLLRASLREQLGAR